MVASWIGYEWIVSGKNMLREGRVEERRYGLSGELSI